MWTIVRKDSRRRNTTVQSQGHETKIDAEIETRKLNNGCPFGVSYATRPESYEERVEREKN